MTKLENWRGKIIHEMDSHVLWGDQAQQSEICIDHHPVEYPATNYLVLFCNLAGHRCSKRQCPLSVGCGRLLLCRPFALDYLCSASDKGTSAQAKSCSKAERN